MTSEVGAKVDESNDVFAPRTPSQGMECDLDYFDSLVSGSGECFIASHSGQPGLPPCGDEVDSLTIGSANNEKVTPSLHEQMQSGSTGVDLQTSEINSSRNVGLPPAGRMQTKVTEVQWSDFSTPFGEQGGFGSFSDLLEEFPEVSVHQEAITEPVWNSSTTFNFPSTASGSGLGAQTSDASGLDFFDMQHGYLEGHHRGSEFSSQRSTFSEEPQIASSLNGLIQQTHSQVLGHETRHDQLNYFRTADLPEQRLTEAHEPGLQLLSNVVEQQQVQGRGVGAEQQGQSNEADQGEWQSLYPGWLYNNVTGEWREISGCYTKRVMADNASEEHAGVNKNETSDRLVEKVPHFDNQDDLPNSDTVFGYALHSMPENESRGSEQQLGNNDLAHTQVGESVWPQANGEGTVSQQQQTGWENQYPGWYYDYQTQSWLECSQISWQAGTVPNSSVSVVGQEQSTVLQAEEYRTTNQGYAGQESFQHNYETSIGYDHHAAGHTSDGWFNRQDQFYSSGNQASSTEVSTLTSQSMTGAHQYDGKLISESSTGPYNQDSARTSDQWASLNKDQFASAATSYHTDAAYVPGQNWDAGFGNQLQAPTRNYNQFEISQRQSYSQQAWVPQHHGQVSFQTTTPPKSTADALRSSVGRPPHVLTTFGFGGKLVIMKLKDPLSLHATDGEQSVASGQAWVPGPVHIHNLSQVVAQTSEDGSWEHGRLYFNALARPTGLGPFVGGSISNKELLKWVDDRASNCVSEEPSSRHPESLAILWGLLKVAQTHYGNLRSNVGAGGGIMSQEGPEVALGRLLTSQVNQSPWTTSSLLCLQSLPSEHQLQVTAAEVKKLLVAGKLKDALKQAQQGHLWGPALVLARQLGEKFYSDTVTEMAQHQFVPGSPLRTLSLLLAGQPAEVFSGKNLVASSRVNSMQVTSTSGELSQDGLGSMLEEWQENLAIMAANRTIGDERVILHLGDCLWRVKGEVEAAHICYLVADGSFESFSSSARLCLIGSDHFKYPRTYTTPEAIQRTELYEYAKVLGNPQYILLPFQPYKLIYASMLAEAGRTSEALRYCQAVLKTLKTASRAPEVEACRVAAAGLEERLRYYVQDTSGLAPGKLINRFLGVLDRGIHGIIGGPPPSMGQDQSGTGSGEAQFDMSRPGFSPIRTTSPLVPSASSEGFANEPARSNMPQRSVSEPDFSKGPMKDKSDIQGKGKAANGATSSGYLGRFGSSIFQKAVGAVGFVAKSNKKEAKLGERNKFYYDEKLKRWVEEGVEVPQEELTPPPPPTSAKFVPSYEEPTDSNSVLGTGSKISSLGTPPVPPSNQFSARRSQGVRSRYVDTFNKAGASTPGKVPVMSSLVPAARAAAGGSLQPMNFFVPAQGAEGSNGLPGAFENGTSVGHSDEAYAGFNSSFASNPDDKMDTFRPRALQNVFLPNNEMVAAPLHRVSSAEIASGAAVEFSAGNGDSDKNLTNGDVGFTNGYHSRAASWSGYPSGFQAAQFSADVNQFRDNSSAYSNLNGFSSERPVSSKPLGSYFQSPLKNDLYKNFSDGMSDTSLPPPPSIEPFPGAARGSFISTAGDERTGNITPTALVAEDLQEVEL